MIWKTFGGRCIHNLNGIQVYQNLAYRWLTFGSDAIQTLISRSHPEYGGLRYIHPLTLAARANPAPTCLLGLGGAGVAHTLVPFFGDNIILDTIESSQEVIKIASLYFMTKKIKNLNIIHQDALLHVQNTSTRYQHLIIDLFSAHSFPSHCNNKYFFNHCQRILLPNGILAINLANVHEQWSVFMHIRTHFKQCTVSIPVKGTPNMIVLASKGMSVTPLLNLLENKYLKQLTWDSTWGCVAQII